MNERQQDRLVSAIFDLAAGATPWGDVLGLLGQSFNCHFAACVSTTPDRSQPRSVGAFGVDAEDHQAFLRDWHRGSPYGNRRLAGGGVVRGSSILPKRELLRSDIYNGYFRPREIEESLRLEVMNDADQIQVISLSRPWASGAYTPREMAFAQRLVPHFQRALVLMKRLHRAEGMTGSAFASLDAVNACVVLLDRGGRIVHASAAAAALLRQADGLISTPGGLQADTLSGSTRLADLIAGVTGGNGRQGGSGTLRLPRRSGKPALTLIAMRLPAGSGATALLHITDPMADASPGVPEMIGLYGLTVAEAGVVAPLLKGLTAAEIAASTGRTLATIRTHIANLMAKTETNRQSELIRQLARLPHQP